MDKLKREMVDYPIVVEGKNDKIALMKFGFDNIFTVSGNAPEIIADRIADDYKNVVILTDYDKEGEKQAVRLKKLFEHQGIKTLTTERYVFRKLFRITKIEEIIYFAKEI